MRIEYYFPYRHRGRRLPDGLAYALVSPETKDVRDLPKTIAQLSYDTSRLFVVPMNPFKTKKNDVAVFRFGELTDLLKKDFAEAYAVVPTGDTEYVHSIASLDRTEAEEKLAKDFVRDFVEDAVMFSDPSHGSIEVMGSQKAVNRCVRTLLTHE